MTILDTNVLSEVMRVSPSPVVARWLLRQPLEAVYTTAVSQAEVLYGIELLPKGKRRAELLAFAEPMFQVDFAERILPFDAEAAREFAEISVARRILGRPISPFDAQIAAIARSRRAILATRDTTDFTGCGVETFDPWRE